MIIKHNGIMPQNIKATEPDIKLSILSRTPPWPGSNVPVSFLPAYLLTTLIKRSPIIEKMTVTEDNKIICIDDGSSDEPDDYI